jgi:hypothetical protein
LQLLLDILGFNLSQLKENDSIDRVVICAPMDHIIYSEYYERIARKLHARVEKYGRSGEGVGVTLEILFFIKYFFHLVISDLTNKKECSYFIAMFNASKQRSIRMSKDAKGHPVNYISYFFKNIYYYGKVHSAIKKSKVVLVISTPEPYVESVTLRVISKQVKAPCIAIFGQTFLQVYKDLNPCISVRNNFASYKSYALDNFKRSQIEATTDYLNELQSNNGGSTLAHRRIKASYVTKNLKDSVVIYLHDLFDSPNLYGGNLFKNHIQWLEKTIRFLNKEKIIYYIKPHPNATRRSRELIQKMISKNKLNTKNILNSKINIFKQMEKPRLIITVYGHISIEAPYYGIDVVCAGSSPSVAFDFTYSPKNQKEYFNSINSVMVEGKEKEKLEEDIILANLCNKYKDSTVQYKMYIKNPGESAINNDINCTEDLKDKFYSDKDFKSKVVSQMNSDEGNLFFDDIKDIVNTKN